MRIDAIRQRLRGHGARACHEQRVLRLWACALPHDGGRRRPGDFLPQRLRDALPALLAELDALARQRAEHPAADGSARLLVELADGQTVESVRLPGAGLCVSTQVGCAVGCVFCMTGRGGLVRQLGSAEIVAQVALARRAGPVRKVVFMGMGEPAHNLDAVIEAVELLGTEGGIGHKRLVVSSVGDPRLVERLLEARVRPALALSLHSTDAGLRARLLPRAPALAPHELVALGTAYAEATRHPVQYQWTLLDGVNDGEAEVDGLVRLLAGRQAHLNLIPYNAVDGLDFCRPPPARAAAMARALLQRGVRATLRHSAAQDVDGGCGQLRARSSASVASGAAARRRIAIVHRPGTEPPPCPTPSPSAPAPTASPI